MFAAERLAQEMCAETRAGVVVDDDAVPGRSTRLAGVPWTEGLAWRAVPEPRRRATDELWPPGGANRPVVALPLAANQDLARHLHELGHRAPDADAGWLLLLGLLHALDEASRARPRVPTVGDALRWSGAPTLGAWASAMTLGDLETALLRARPGAQARPS